MPFINDEVFDSGLDYADANGTRIDVCSSEPATYAAIAAITLGNKTGLNTGATEDDAASPSNGRMVVVPAISDGDITNSGTATHWALTNGSDTLIATGAFLSPTALTAGNKFNTAEIEIKIRDAAGAAPVNTVAPAVSGTESVGSLLSVTDGTWDNSPTGYTYQWFQALVDGSGNVLTDGDGNPLGVEISGATSNTYTLQSGDSGEKIFCEVTATNGGASATASSNVTGAIA